jgi:cyclophilin family peptidyl-prolyl cis-trans isomerase
MATPRRDEKKSRERQARAARLAAQRRQRMIKTFTVFGVFAVVLVLIGSSFSLLSSDSSDNAADPTTTSTTTATPVANTPCPAADGSTPRKIDFESGIQNCIDPAKKYTATFNTTEGNIVVALDTAKTPNTTNNFVGLARYHYFDGTQIFRTDPSIDIIQGGSPHTNDASDPGPGYNIPDEGSGYQYAEGDLVMARSRGPNGASAQFFFGTGTNVAGLAGQQYEYVNFGKTTAGLEVLKTIIGLHTPTNDGLGGKPSRTVTVNSVTIAEA